VAREVIVRTWCDVCLDNDQETDATELAPLLLPEVGGTKPRVVALCEVHLKEVYQPLVDVLRDHGQIVDEEGNPSGPRGKYGKAKPGDPGSWNCPAEGCEHVSPNRAAISSHVRNMHNTTLAVLLGQATPYECPECGLKSARPQGLAAHRRTVHGIVGVSNPAHPGNQEDGADLFTPEAPETAPEAAAPEKPKAAKKAAPRARKKAAAK
jgi:hypothetical protein